MTRFSLFNPKTRVGEHARPRALLDAPRVQPFAGRGFRTRSGLACATVFREGAEKSARGGRAPISTSDDASLIFRARFRRFSCWKR